MASTVEDAYARLAANTRAAKGERGPKTPRDNSTEAKLARARERLAKLESQAKMEEHLSKAGPRPSDIRAVGRAANKLRAAINVLGSDVAVEAMDALDVSDATRDKLLASTRDFLGALAKVISDDHASLLAEFQRHNPGVALDGSRETDEDGED